MTINSSNILSIISVIDFFYLSNYLKKSLEKSLHDNYYYVDEWKIFSIHPINSKFNDEPCNILHLIQKIISRDEFDYEILLWTIHIYRDICIKYADMIDNYVYLFGTIYVSANIINEKHISEYFLANTFNIDPCIIKKMLKTVNNYMDNNDIYFGLYEKEKLINLIKSSS